jgi:hypothetical protein
MIELAMFVVKTRQERSDLAALALISEAADHTVCRPQTLDFDHGALAWLIWSVQPLGDNAVRRSATDR